MTKTKLSACRLGLLAGLLGSAALCLPFYYRYIPYDYFKYKLHRGDWPEAILAWAGLLAIPIAIWHALRLIGKKVGGIEIGIIYILSAGAMLTPPAWSTMLVYEILAKGSPLSSEVLLLQIPSLLVIANFVLLWRNLKSKRAPEMTCGVFLLGAYVPNALQAITYVIIIANWFGWDEIGPGASFVLSAVILCLGSIVLSMSTRSRPLGQNETELE